MLRCILKILDVLRKTNPSVMYGENRSACGIVPWIARVCSRKFKSQICH